MNHLHGKQPIDIHAHFYPEAYLRLFAQVADSCGGRYREDPRGPVIDVGPLHAGPLDRKFIDLDLRIEAMDEQGVAVQALSLTQPMVYFGDDDTARRLTEAFNDSLMEAHERYPDRLVGLAALPMQNPTLALRELERITSLSGIRGVYVGTAIWDTPLSDPSLLPVWEAIADQGLPVFLHPVKVIGMEDRLTHYFLSNLLGNPFDTAVAAAHLIFGGILDRFPALQVVLPHAGGALPFLSGRLAHGWKVRPECRHLECGPNEYLDHFFYDTISHSDAALAFLIDQVGADRVLLGSDYCFDMGYDKPVDAVMNHPTLDAEDRAKILENNARGLLGLPTGAGQRREGEKS